MVCSTGHKRRVYVHSCGMCITASSVMNQLEQSVCLFPAYNYAGTAGHGTGSTYKARKHRGPGRDAQQKRREGRKEGRLLVLALSVASADERLALDHSRGGRCP